MDGTDPTDPVAGALAAALLLHNIFVLPRTLPSVLRGGGPRTDVGALAYPAGVLVVILLFRDRLELAAAAWAILAAGDGAASLIGRRSTRALFWNPAKTWAGCASFVVAGAVAGAGALWFVAGGGGSGGGVSGAVSATTEGIGPGAALAIAGPAALAAAIAESVRSRLDDNVRILVATSVALALAVALSSG